MTEFLVITGLSGAGRSQAAATLEDLGWFVVDNLPIALIAKIAELASTPGSAKDRVVLVVGRDIERIDDLEAELVALRDRGIRVTTLFLEASDEVLIRRFEGTRRRHPLGRQAVAEAIAAERERLGPLRARADLVLDTSELSVSQLRERLTELFADSPDQALQVAVTSFGFKYGLPLDVDNVFDVRFLPNPYWVEALKDSTGLDPQVRDFVLKSPEAVEFLAKVDELLAYLLPFYVKEGKSYLTVAFGCTGGKHRSVALAEQVAAKLRQRGYRPAVHHRDLNR